MKFQVYDTVEDELIRPANDFLLAGNGEAILRWNGNEYEDVTARYEVSFFIGQQDMNGEDIYGGDFIKRTRDENAEWARENEDLDEELIHDKSGGLGVVTYSGMGYAIQKIEGPKRTFHGPEGGINFSWDEVEIVGNKWTS